MTIEQNLFYVIVGMIFWQIVKAFGLIIEREIRERRQNKFIRAVKIEFPGNTKITLIAVESSDRKAIANLKKQIYEPQNALSDEYIKEHGLVNYNSRRKHGL